MQGRKLSNVPENPCIGCGPQHPAGLRLEFHLADDVVRTALEVTRDRVGWPDRLHSGILYLAMLETANWTLYGVTSRVGIPAKTSALVMERWVAVGETLELRGTLRSSTDRAAHVDVEAYDEGGKGIARLDRQFDLVDRDAFLKRMGYAELPPGLDDGFPA